MPSLLYYTAPFDGPADADRLLQLGIGHAIDNATKQKLTKKEMIGPGPDGEIGVVLQLPTGDHDRCGYYPDEQNWYEIEDRGEGLPKLWIGWSGDKPKPADLARDTQLPGEPLGLDDGQTYLVPVLRAWLEEQETWARTLPGRLKRRGGVWTQGEVRGEHARLWEANGQAFDYLRDTFLSGESQIELDPIYDHAAELLGSNYRIGPEEIEALGLFYDDTVLRVIETSCQFRKFRDHVENVVSKKKATAESSESSSPGGAD